MKPPENSKITVTQEGDRLTFELAPSRSLKSLLIWLLLTGVWTFSFWGFITNDAPVIFLIPIGLMMLLSPMVFLFYLVGKRKVTIDPDHFTFQWSLFSYKRIKKRNWKKLKEIRKVRMYQSRHKWVYGIGLFFKGEKKIKFGSSLSDEDRNYLIRTFEKLKK